MTNIVPCPKCGGTGRIGTLAHVAGGECFRCHGTGRVVETKVERLARLEHEALTEIGYDPFSGLSVSEFVAQQLECEAAL